MKIQCPCWMVRILAPIRVGHERESGDAPGVEPSAVEPTGQTGDAVEACRLPHSMRQPPARLLECCTNVSPASQPPLKTMLEMLGT